MTNPCLPPQSKSAYRLLPLFCCPFLKDPSFVNAVRAFTVRPLPTLNRSPTPALSLRFGSSFATPLFPSSSLRRHHIHLLSTSISCPHPSPVHIHLKSTSISCPHPSQVRIHLQSTSISSPHPSPVHILLKSASISSPGPSCAMKHHPAQ